MVVVIAVLVFAVVEVVKLIVIAKIKINKKPGGLALTVDRCDHCCCD